MVIKNTHKKRRKKILKTAQIHKRHLAIYAVWTNK